MDGWELDEKEERELVVPRAAKALRFVVVLWFCCRCRCCSLIDAVMQIEQEGVLLVFCGFSFRAGKWPFLCLKSCCCCCCCFFFVGGGFFPCFFFMSFELLMISWGVSLPPETCVAWGVGVCASVQQCFLFFFLISGKKSTMMALAVSFLRLSTAFRGFS